MNAALRWVDVHPMPGSLRRDAESARCQINCPIRNILRVSRLRDLWALN